MFFIDYYIDYYIEYYRLLQRISLFGHPLSAYCSPQRTCARYSLELPQPSRAVNPKATGSVNPPRLPWLPTAKHHENTV